jgi:hypothetical protein
MCSCGRAVSAARTRVPPRGDLSGGVTERDGGMTGAERDGNVGGVEPLAGPSRSITDADAWRRWVGHREQQHLDADPAAALLFGRRGAVGSVIEEKGSG